MNLNDVSPNEKPTTDLQWSQRLDNIREREWDFSMMMGRAAFEKLEKLTGNSTKEEFDVCIRAYAAAFEHGRNAIGGIENAPSGNTDRHEFLAELQRALDLAYPDQEAQCT